MKLEARNTNNIIIEDFSGWLFLSMVVILSPFICLYNISESILFQASAKRRRKEFQKINLGKPDNCNLYRYIDPIVLHYRTSEGLYPNCEISVWASESTIENYPLISRETHKEFYSIKLPQLYHTETTDGWLDIIEKNDFKHWNIEGAITIVHYNTNYLQFLCHNSAAHESGLFMDVDTDELKPVECSIKLLVEDQIDGINSNRVKYYCQSLGIYKLERKQFGKLKSASKKKLVKKLRMLGLPSLI